MYRRIALLLFGLSFMTAAAAQPAIQSYRGVSNSASYIGPEVGSGAGLAQGSIFAVFGSVFGDAGSLSEATSYPLPTTQGLGGVTVQVTVGGTTTNAIMLSVVYGFQINAVLPSATPLGTGTMTVSYGGATSAPAPIVVVPNSFGIYAINQQGVGQASMTDVNFEANSIIHTFHPGDVAILWGTGLGAVSWDETEPPPGPGPWPLNVPVTVYVGTTAAPSAPSDYHGRSGYAGLDQLVFTVPQGVEGCYVPVAVKAGAVVSNIITMAISSTGNTCSDSIMGQDLINQLAAGQSVNFGLIRLEGGAATGDYASATFNGFTPATAVLASYGVSSGYCVAMEGNWYTGFTLTDLTTPNLNAGAALTLVPHIGTFQLPQSYYAGNYTAEVGSIGNRALLGGYQVSVSGPSGPDVGEFTASHMMPTLGSTITNIGRFSIVPRSSDLTVEWEPSVFAQPDGVALLGGASETATVNGSAYESIFQCTVPVAPGQFTIPAWVLSLLPPSGTQTNLPLGYLWLGQYDTPTTFTAPGLDKGLMMGVSLSLAFDVSFQ